MTKHERYYGNPREDLIKFIPADAEKILDIGCGKGALKQALKRMREAEGVNTALEVVGVELDNAIAREAGKNLDRVIAGDIEKIDLPYEPGYFDCLVYGDVLEHLVDPWTLLKRHAGLLKPGGCVIASIPNIANYRIIKMLKSKEWNYEKAGILDIDHIRFFTIKTIRDLFSNAGLKITKIENNIAASKVKRFLNKIFLNSLMDSITEQYLIFAVKNYSPPQK